MEIEPQYMAEADEKLPEGPRHMLKGVVMVFSRPIHITNTAPPKPQLHKKM